MRARTCGLGMNRELIGFMFDVWGRYGEVYWGSDGGTMTGSALMW